MNALRPSQTAVAAAIAACAFALLGAVSADAAVRQVPYGFLGVNWTEPLYAQQVDTAKESGAMAQAGAESVRFGIFWDQIQPFKSWAQVPPAQRAGFVDFGGVPTAIYGIDNIVHHSAAHGLEMFPVVAKTPVWNRRFPQFKGASPPKSNVPLAKFVRGLVQRYGPNGAYWRTHPEVAPLPIRRWAMFNEPNHKSFWRSNRPFHRDYVALLRATRRAIKGADPKAQVILAALVSRGWEELEKLYAVGAKGQFDAVSINAYTAEVDNVVRLLDNAREVMNKHGDRRIPIYATELTWVASRGVGPSLIGFPSDRRQQASNLASLLPKLAAARTRLNLAGAFWYGWIDKSKSRLAGFDYAGLRTLRGNGTILNRPVFASFQRAARTMEGCAKASDARFCVP